MRSAQHTVSRLRLLLLLHGEEGSAGEQGFTLMELLIVVAVLGILAAIVIFSLSGITGQAAAAACNSDADSVETAVSAYNAQNPTGPTVTQTVLVPTYLHSWPASTNYAITLVNGTVMIAAPATATAVAYGTTGACSGAGGGGGGGTPSTSTTTTTTTTVPPTTTTTTTAPVSNGVTATPTTQTYGNGYGGQDILTVNNPSAITAMTITITVAQTAGVSPSTGYNSFPGGIATYSYGFTNTYTLNPGQSIPANDNGSFAAQYAGTGYPRIQTGDTWTVVSTSNGVTSTISGVF